MSLPVLVTLPLPHPSLSPNARPHHMTKARLKKKARNDGYLAGVKARIDCQHEQPFELAEAHATFYVRTNRNRDGDNALASLKASFDGLADAGIFRNDSGLRHYPVKFEVDKKNPRVELLIRPIEVNHAH